MIKHHWHSVVESARADMTQRDMVPLDGNIVQGIWEVLTSFNRPKSQVPPLGIAYGQLVLLGLYPHRLLVPDSLDNTNGSSRYETWTWIFPPKSRVNWTNDRSYCLVTESGQKSVAEGCWRRKTSNGILDWLEMSWLVYFGRLDWISVEIPRSLSTLACWCSLRALCSQNKNSVYLLSNYCLNFLG